MQYQQSQEMHRLVKTSAKILVSVKCKRATQVVASCSKLVSGLWRWPKPGDDDWSHFSMLNRNYGVDALKASQDAIVAHMDLLMELCTLDTPSFNLLKSVQRRGDARSLHQRKISRGILKKLY